MIKKQECINTVRCRSLASMVVIDHQLYEGSFGEITYGDTLSHQILSDLEYGVTSRPSIPACFEDEDELAAGFVDPATDIRASRWDILAGECDPRRVTPVVPTPPPDTNSESEK